MKKFFISRHFKNLKSHNVQVSGEYGNYDIYFEPKNDVKHRYTIILLHDAGDNAWNFYRWIASTLPDFFGRSKETPVAEGEKDDVMKYARIVIPNNYANIGKLDENFDQNEL